MSIVRWPILVVVLGLLMVLGQAGMAAQETATPEPFAPEVWVSPTPDETGTIAVIVQPGESLWLIAARAGLTLPELLALNNLTEAAIIKPGDVVVIAYTTPEPTAVQVSPIATMPPPTLRPTEARPAASICLSAFNDLDRDGIRDPDEPLRAGVAFTVYDSQAVVANYITDGVSEPHCIGGIVPGEYRVTRSVIPGEVLTTAGDWALNMSPNSQLYQSFGSFVPDGDGQTTPTTAAAIAEVTSAATRSASSPPATPIPTAVAEFPAEAASPLLAGRIIVMIALFLGGLTLLAAVLILLMRQARGRSSPGGAAEDAEAGRRFHNIDDLD